MGMDFLMLLRESSRYLLVNSTELSELYPFMQRVGNPKCGITRYSNKSIIVIGNAGFEGIPENLAVNVCGWAVLLLIFSFLNKAAWNRSHSDSNPIHDQSWIELFYGDAIGAKLLHSNPDMADKVENLVDKKGCRFWLHILCKIGLDHVRFRSGLDAVEYLTFQKHIIAYIFIVCLLTSGCILPLHWHGNLEDERKVFARTTMSNLASHSPLMWIHTVISLLFVFLCIMVMRHYSNMIRIQEKAYWVKRTVMIRGIESEYRSPAKLQEYFQKNFPSCVVENIQFAFDVRRLTKLDYKRENSQAAKIWCQAEFEARNKKLQMIPKVFGAMCACSTCCKKIDALEYYTAEEQQLIDEINKEKEETISEPLGFAFVTLETHEMASMVVSQERRRHAVNACENSCENSDSATRIPYARSHQWTFSYAPTQKNIIWENLAVGRKRFVITSALINFGLFLVLFFLTTPGIVVTTSGVLTFSKALKKVNPVVSEFLPTFALWICALCLPAVISFSNQFLHHRTRSSQNRSVMKKTFIFLMFMVIILPSLGLTSAHALFQWAIKESNETYRWECFFLPDNGAFFVNYVITSGFVGTAMQFIRLPELFLYVIYMCLSRSKAEKSGSRKAVLWEFNFGVHYAWYLLIFALVSIYSVPCPLIVPFGLFYLVFKHYVDVYNICFVYAPSQISYKVHTLAIFFVMLSLFLKQVALFFFIFVRTGWSLITLGNLICLIITTLACCIQEYVPCCRFAPSLSLPHKREVKKEKLCEDEYLNASKAYIPEVLR